MAESQTTWLSQESFDRLSAELRDLETRGREEVAERIEAARSEGDLRENGGYQAAREEQSMNETRVLQLEDLLRDAEVGETPADDGVVEAGMVVTAKIAGEEETFLLGARDAGEGLNMHVYSPTAPLGRAIVGLSAGESTTYETPAGMKIKVEVISAVPYQA